MSSISIIISEDSAIYTLKEKGLFFKEIIEICTGNAPVESSKICQKVPSPQKNSKKET